MVCTQELLSCVRGLQPYGYIKGALTLANQSCYLTSFLPRFKHSSPFFSLLFPDPLPLSVIIVLLLAALLPQSPFSSAQLTHISLLTPIRHFTVPQPQGLNAAVTALPTLPHGNISVLKQTMLPTLLNKKMQSPAPKELL